MMGGDKGKLCIETIRIETERGSNEQRVLLPTPTNECSMIKYSLETVSLERRKGSLLARPETVVL